MPVSRPSVDAMPLIASISDGRLPWWSSSIEGRRVRHAFAEDGDIGDGIVEGKGDALGPAKFVNFSRTAQRDLPLIRTGHQLADGAIEGSAGRAERAVAKKLFPDQLVDVLEGFHLETGALPDCGDVI